MLMNNYLIANFRLHHFISLGYRKLANIRKTMQIGKPFVQKNIFFCFLPNFLGKMTSPQPVKCSISNFYTFWPSLLNILYLLCTDYPCCGLNIPVVDWIYLLWTEYTVPVVDWIYLLWTEYTCCRLNIPVVYWISLWWTEYPCCGLNIPRTAENATGHS